VLFQVKTWLQYSLQHVDAETESGMWDQVTNNGDERKNGPQPGPAISLQ